MTKVTPEAGKERAWGEDHQRHHLGEVRDATTPGADQAPAPAVS